ncbi:MAG: hypothetical protein IKB06_01140 [Clostridia bacterium]|nr:hypothetical protein [Clostridia bacterium]
MKKLYFVFCFLITLFFVCSCSSTKTVSATNNEFIASEISKIENAENLNQETVKALAVLIQSKKNNQSQKQKNSYSDKILKIVNSVKKDEVEFPKEFDFEIAVSKNQEWKVSISKTNLLEKLSEENITVANMSDISPVYYNETFLHSIIIAGKEIPYKTLKDWFGLKSNNIKEFEIQNKFINIVGVGFDNDKIFDLEKAENLANAGNSHTDILVKIFDGYDIKIK